MIINLNYWNTRVIRYPMLASAVIFALVITGLVCDLTKSDWSSWVQAVGSVAAIVGAFFFGRSQSIRDRENALHLAQVANKEKWSTVKAIIDNLYRQCRDVAPGFANEEEEFGNIAFVLSYNKDQFDEAVKLVESIPLFELNSEALARCVIDFRRNARRYGGWVDYAKSYMAGRVNEQGVNAPTIKGCANIALEAIHLGYEEIVDVVGIPGIGRNEIGPVWPRTIRIEP